MSMFTEKKILSFFICAFFFFGILSSCAPKRHHSKKTRVHKTQKPRSHAKKNIAKPLNSNHKIQVHLRSAPNWVPDKLRDNIDHPFSFTDEELSLMLRAMTYQEWDRVGIYGKGKPVFSKSGINALAPVLSREFQKANKDQVVFFNISKKAGNTKGVTFVSNGNLYWKIGFINNKPYDFKDIFQGSWDKEDFKHSNWKLETKRGQKLVVAKGILTKHAEGDFLNISLKYYSVAGLGVPQRRTSKIHKERNEEIPGTQEKGSVLERYLDLKKLKKEKIVDDAQYNRKARALMREKRSLSIPDELKLLNYFRMDGLISEGEYEKEKKKLIDKL